MSDQLQTAEEKEIDELICCAHKRTNGLSAFDFVQGSSGNNGETFNVTVFVCLKCGAIKVSGHRGQNSFNEVFNIDLPKHVESIVKYSKLINGNVFSDVPTLGIL